MTGKRGRPINEDLLDRIVKELSQQPRTIKALSVHLNEEKRTVYRYIDKAVEAGVNIVKLGLSKDSPYYIMPGRSSKL